MMTGIDEQTPAEGVAAIVWEALQAHGIDAVLTGGTVVSVYTENAYVSEDLDFVIRGLDRDLEPVMTSLGFSREGRHWVHPRTPFFVEFPPGPVAVGDRLLDTFALRETSWGRLRILTPTQSVMDRLAAWFHWTDHPSLDQAVAVAERHPVDLDAIRTFAKAERMEEKLDAFIRRLGAGST